jgi:hypothetical protein
MDGSDALESPIIDLHGHAQARLRFATWYAFDDCGGVPDAESDGGLVEVSEEGSGTWVPIAPINGYPWVLDENCNNPLGGRPAFSHHSAAGDSFETEQFDLSAFAGKAIRIRFLAGWDCGNCEITRGWFIDDVKVSTDAPSWVSVLPARGGIEAGEVAPSAIAFATAGLAPGSHQASLRLRSNDPDQPVVTVPLELTLADMSSRIDVTPKTVNLAERRKWLQVSIELPAGLDPATISPATLRLNDAAHADPAFVTLGDRDHDGVPDLTVRFALDEVRGTLQPMPASMSPVLTAPGRGGGDAALMWLTGATANGTTFLGRDTVRVLRPRLAQAGGEVLSPASPLRVSWTASPDWAGTTASLLFSRNGGITWQPIADGLAAPRYDWKVPNVRTRHGLLRAEFRDAEGTLAIDVLERPLTIGAGPVADAGTPHIERLALRGAPNPFADGTDITLALPRSGVVDLAVFDVDGRRLRTLLRGPHDPGLVHLRWDGRNAQGARLAPGVYFLRVKTPDATATWRATLLR